MLEMTINSAIQNFLFLTPLKPPFKPIINFPTKFETHIAHVQISHVGRLPPTMSQPQLIQPNPP